MQAVDTSVERRALARLPNRLLDLLARFGDHFLDACGVDAPVEDQLAQVHTRDLAAHGIERRENHRLRGIVDDEVHARGRLQGADVAPLLADDAPLHVFVGQVHHGDGRLGHDVGGAALDRHADDLLRAHVGFGLDLGLHVAHAAFDVGFQLQLELGDEHGPGLIMAQLGNALECRNLLLAQRLHLLTQRVELLLLLRELTLAAFQALATTVEGLLLLEHALLLALQVGTPLPVLGFRCIAQPDRLIFGLEQDLLLLGLCLQQELLCRGTGGAVPLLGHQHVKGAADQTAHDEGNHDRYNHTCVHQTASRKLLARTGGGWQTPNRVVAAPLDGQPAAARTGPSDRVVGTRPPVFRLLRQNGWGLQPRRTRTLYFIVLPRVYWMTAYRRRDPDVS